MENSKTFRRRMQTILVVLVCALLTCWTLVACDSAQQGSSTVTRGDGKDLTSTEIRRDRASLQLSVRSLAKLSFEGSGATRQQNPDYATDDTKKARCVMYWYTYEDAIDLLLRVIEVDSDDQESIEELYAEFEQLSSEYSEIGRVVDAEAYEEMTSRE